MPFFVLESVQFLKVMLLSKRSSEFKFQVRELTTKAIQSVYKNKGLVFDKALKPPASIAKPFTNPEKVPGNAYR